MTVLSHESAPERRGWAFRLPTEMWASAAIIAIWVAVLVDAVFGPDITATNAAGDTTTIPTVVPVGLYAFLATAVVAWAGLRRGKQ